MGQASPQRRPVERVLTAIAGPIDYAARWEKLERGGPGGL